MRKQKIRNLTYNPPHTSARERDYQLAQSALNGDMAAWETLYEKSVLWVPGAVEKADPQHCFSRWDYQDIADEALSRCYAQLERYQGLSQFHWWVLGYAKNILRNRRQAQLTRSRYQYLLAWAADETSFRHDPLWILLRLERDQYLWDAFFQLEPLDQAIVHQRVFFQTSYRTLARQVQLTRNQVRQHYEDALNAIRWNFLRRYRTGAPALQVLSPVQIPSLLGTVPESLPW